MAPQHFGALPKRSAIDLVVALVQDIEQALNKGQVATLVTAEVKGAFDAALVGRLVVWMREQGWPNTLIRWTESFMTDRSVRVHFEGAMTESFALACGLPQGSPVPPILCMLYTEPICGQLGVGRRRLGFADDVGSLTIRRTLQETAADASHQLQDLIS